MKSRGKNIRSKVLHIVDFSLVSRRIDSIAIRVQRLTNKACKVFERKASRIHSEKGAQGVL